MWAGVCGYAWVCACVWDEFSEFLLENRVHTSADFNTYPIRIFLITNHISLHFILQVPFTVIQAMGDEFMSCDSYSRRESRVLEAIPCDMTTTNYCKIKGPSYPE